MTSRKKRKKKKTGLLDIINLISSLALIVIAALLVVFVYFYIKNNSLFSSLSSGKLSFFAEKKEKDDVQIESIEITSEVTYGLNELHNGDVIFLIDPEKVSSYDEECVVVMDDGSKVLANSWYEENDHLYFFGEEGYALSSYSEGAMDFSFGKDHVLNKIEYNPYYSLTEEFDDADYHALVSTKVLWAYLDTTKGVGDLYPIRFRKTVDSLSHELGGGSNPQYSSDYALTIDDGFIYYVAVTDSDNKIIEPVANKLFRMKPGADYREIVAENCKGYKILVDDDSSKVYYYDGSSVRRATSFEKDEQMRIFDENATYLVDIDNKKAILKMDGIYPVTMENPSFKSGNFIYSISSEGEILSVADKTSVAMGGYTYSLQNGEAFGTKKSRLIRTDSSGSKEVISAEFAGETSNIHYDFDSSRIIAEYKDANGAAGLLSISLSGDVETVFEATDLGKTCVLYAIQSGSAIVKTSDQDEPFKKVKLSTTYPLAVGVDPIPLDAKPDKTEKIGPTSSGTDTSAVTGAPSGSSTASAAPGTGAASSNDAPGQINNSQVEKKGPGEN